MAIKKSGRSGDIVPIERISQAILLIRGHKIMLDSDLAELYEVEIKTLNQAVKRNIERFPGDFMLQLTAEEAARLRSQIVTLKSGCGKHRKYQPYAFTEQGVAMLSSVLRSNRAVQVNIEIMRAFVRLRRMLASNTELARKLAALEQKYDAQFKVVFDAIMPYRDVVMPREAWMPRAAELMRPPEPKKKRPIGFGPWGDK